jgi:hypothetical protein
MPRVKVASRALAVIGFIALSATLAHAGGGQGGGGNSLEGYQCYLVNGVNQKRTVTLADQFGIQENVKVQGGRLLCTPVVATLTDGSEFDLLDASFAFDHFKCYAISSSRLSPAPTVKLRDQLDVETVRVSEPAFLCTIANKNDEPAPPTP